MIVKPMDIGQMAELAASAATQLLDAYEDSGAANRRASNSPLLLVQATERLFDVLRRLEHDRHYTASLSGVTTDTLESQDLHTLGDYGIQLISDLIDWCRRLELPGQQQDYELLMLQIAFWIARRDSEISTLEPVVNALAAVANRIDKPQELEQLYAGINEIMDAVSPPLAQDLDRSNPQRPWRVLLFNRAIVATRSHQPQLMEQAFDTIAEQLPEDAPQFFREGMEQMEALKYPPRVQAVMRRYCDAWCGQRTLH